MNSCELSLNKWFLQFERGIYIIIEVVSGAAGTWHKEDREEVKT